MSSPGNISGRISFVSADGVRHPAKGAFACNFQSPAQPQPPAAMFKTPKKADVVLFHDTSLRQGIHAAIVTRVDDPSLDGRVDLEVLFTEPIAGHTTGRVRDVQHKDASGRDDSASFWTVA